jgi:hypothetical protein
MGMIYSFDDLIAPMTTDEVKALLYDMMGIVGVKTSSWKPGAVVRTIVAIVAVFGAALSVLISKIARGGWLELATGEWLRILAFYVYGVTKHEATFATGSVTIDNTSGNLYSYGAGECVFRNAVTDKTYTNLSALTINPATSGITCTIVAVEAGSASTAAAGEVSELASALTGVTLTNPAAIVGTDAEEAQPLRTRCLERLGALSPNGPWDAYAYIAKSCERADGTPIGITRVRSVPDGYGRVYVFVATATGAVTGDQTDPNTDLGALQLALLTWAAPLGITPLVYSASPVTVDVTYIAYAISTIGLTSAQFTAAALLRLTATFASSPIGGYIKPGETQGYLYADAVRDSIKGDESYVWHVDAGALADTSLAFYEVPVLGTVNGSLSLSNPTA